MQATQSTKRESYSNAAMMRQKFYNLIQSIDESVDIRKMKEKKSTETPRKKALFLSIKWKKIQE